MTVAAIFRRSSPLLSVLALLACTRPDSAPPPVAAPQATAPPPATPAVAAAPASCEHPFGLAVGTELTYKLTDDKDKPTGTQVMKVARIVPHEAAKKTPAYTEVLLKSTLYNADNRLESNDEYTYTCRNDSVLTDGRLLLDPAMLRPFRDRRFVYEPVSLAWPNQPAAGALPAGQLNVQISSPSVDLAHVMTSVRERRLVGPETVTTPAGTFTAYKVESTYEYATQVRPDLTRRSSWRVTDYYAPSVGIVRTEFRTDKGKLDHIIVLAKRTDEP